VKTPNPYPLRTLPEREVDVKKKENPAFIKWVQERDLLRKLEREGPSALTQEQHRALEDARKAARTKAREVAEESERLEREFARQMQGRKRRHIAEED
jgi:hypothetical protein